jgi:eukaryotic-like serine/threonine-protein kinase
MEGRRFELLGTIAAGDFATVYRGRDLELGREVAIKQIHQQFLADPRQLERYWQEAQLLASLEHPNIITIYDIVRSRGWLVLELMRTDLSAQAKGEPMDLDALRIALTHALGALEFLHSKGIIHGDVKPSNLLVDKHGRIKLGDFGLARRVSNEQGSLLKGTTKYMAPELVSNQFGPVGPASDLYSLGFAAYDLMCGPQFENLFPGLGMYGRDRQIAWMMWQAAADRQLPEINRVLEGVPEDLAGVIQRLVAKDRSRRYQSAREALRDLKAEAESAETISEPDLDAEKAEKAKRKRRVALAGGFLATCVVALVAAIFWPAEETPPPAAPKPIVGVVRSVQVERQELVVEVGGKQKPEIVKLRSRDRVLLNDKGSLVQDLKEGDRVEVRRLADRQGRPLVEIAAFRPETTRGVVKKVELAASRLTLATEQGGQPAADLVLAVPAALKIRFNGKDTFNGKAVALADLKAGDQITADHLADSAGRTAAGLNVLRKVSTSGILREINPAKNELTLAVGADANPKLEVLPLAERCEITLNKQRFVQGGLLKPDQLKPGDQVTILHDTQVYRIDAARVFQESGAIQTVGYDAGTVTVAAQPGAAAVTYQVGPQCRLTLGGQKVALTDLRAGDKVAITHESVGSQNPVAQAIEAVRPVDSNKWALIIAAGASADKTLSPLGFPAKDAALLEKTLLARYQVTQDQMLVLVDETRARLEQGIPDLLRRAPGESQVLVYFAGHAILDDTGKVYLAPKDFSSSRTSTTGVSLQWLVQQMEQCAAREKILFLDVCPAGADAKREISAAEAIQTLVGPDQRTLLKTVTAITSCSKGEHSLADGENGRFGRYLAEAFSGRGDFNRDNHLEANELFGYLTEKMLAIKSPALQTPSLTLPDNTPPRLNEEAKSAIRALLALAGQPRIDLTAAGQQFEAAQGLAAREPEPKLAYGLVLFKASQPTKALLQFDEVSLAKPDSLPALEGAAWIRMYQRDYVRGLDRLVQLVERIPKPAKAAAGYTEYALRIMEWAGRLREFVATTPQDRIKPTSEAFAQLDAAVAQHGPAAQQAYQKGRTATRTAMEDIDKRITEAPDTAAATKLEIDKGRINNFAQFSIDLAVQYILEHLNQ